MLQLTASIFCASNRRPALTDKLAILIATADTQHPAWVSTPQIDFGKRPDLVRLMIVFATASCPASGSPFDSKNTPARATVEARLATPKYLVEIMVTAAR